MRVSLNNVWLTNDGTVDLRTWTDAYKVQLNGRQIVQDAQFLRAVSAQPLARGNAVNELRFTVTQQHASVAAASAFTLTAFSVLPTGGSATLVCGGAGETPVTCTFTAVLAEMPGCSFYGTRTETQFVLRGGPITELGGATASTVDGATLATAYGYAAGGTVDGGNLADDLLPAGLDLDGGTLA